MIKLPLEERRFDDPAELRVHDARGALICTVKDRWSMDHLSMLVDTVNELHGRMEGLRK